MHNATWSFRLPWDPTFRFRGTTLLPKPPWSTWARLIGSRKNLGRSPRRPRNLANMSTRGPVGSQQLAYFEPSNRLFQGFPLFSPQNVVNQQPKTGRGNQILTCGDVEGNPGPNSESPEDNAINPVTNLILPPLQPDLPMEVDTPIPRLPSFSCPFTCGLGPWQTRRSVLQHVERMHLPHLEDLTAVQTWLRDARKWACPTCRTIARRDYACFTCGARQFVQPPEPRILLHGDWDDSLWLTVVQNALPVVRHIPPSIADQWANSLTSVLEQVSISSPFSSVLRFAAFCRIILAPTGRGGRAHQKQVVSTLSARLAKWTAGQHQQLVQDYLTLALGHRRLTQNPANDTILPEHTRRAALRAVRDGALGKAARLLSQVHFDLPPDIRTALQNLHPVSAPPASPGITEAIGDDFTVDEIQEAIRRFPPGSAGGFSGLMPSHLALSPSPNYLRMLQHIARITSDFAWGRFPQEHCSFLAGARLVPIGKKGDGVRPIAVGEVFRRLAGKLLVQRYQADCIP